MEQKTKIKADNGKQDLFITREFDLPVELLLKPTPKANLLSNGWEQRFLNLKVKNTVVINLKLPTMAM